MARRRYLSTKISTDQQVNKLARQAGDFAVLLYTWMIPHAEDDGTIRGSVEELTLALIPGRRDKTEQDVEDALLAMHQLGLIHWDGAECIRFPDSFFAYQTYISAERSGGRKPDRGGRKAPPDAAPGGDPAAPGGDDPAKQRKSPQNAAPFKSSVKDKDTSSVIASGERDARAQEEPEPQLEIELPPKSRSVTPRSEPLPEDWRPSRAMLLYLGRRGLDQPRLDQEFRRFVGRARANGMVSKDWDASFQSFCAMAGSLPGNRPDLRLNRSRAAPVGRADWPTDDDYIADAAEANRPRRTAP